MKQYLELLKTIMENGADKDDRTGIGTKSIFGKQMRFNLSLGFPLLTTKKVHLKSVIYELLWFLRGDTNVQYLHTYGVSIWDEWADENGDLGPIYGKQWRRWETKDGRIIDQISQVIEDIKTNPNSRRLIVSAWNVGELQNLIKAKKTAPPPCHLMFQFYVVNNELSLQLYQRSADAFLGVPFNIASYSLLLMMVASITSLTPKEFIHTLGDVHIYRNHFEQVKLQLSREPRTLPILKINPHIKQIDDFTYEDFELIDYNPHPSIKAPIAI